jgi:hypothetical protein
MGVTVAVLGRSLDFELHLAETCQYNARSTSSCRLTGTGCRDSQGDEYTISAGHENLHPRF